MQNKEKKNLIKSKVYIFFIALLCSILWGSSFPIIKYSFSSLNLNNMTSKLYFASYRFLLAGILIFFILIILKKKIILINKKDYINVSLIGLFQTSLLYSFFYIGLSNTTGIKAAIITSSGSFFLVIISHYLFKNDKINIKKILGLLLGFTGVLLINLDGLIFFNNITLKNLKGELFILLGAIFATIGNILVKYTIKRIEAPLICAYQFTIGSIFLFCFTLILETPNIILFSKKYIVLLLSLSLISAIAFSLWYLLVKYDKLSKIAIYRFLIPINGTLFSSLFIEEETMNFFIFLSLLLVCLGIFLTSYQKKKKF